MKKFNRFNIKNFISGLNNFVYENLPIDVAFLGLGSDGHTALFFQMKILFQVIILFILLKINLDTIA